jgi:hypothetical protein
MECTRSRTSLQTGCLPLTGFFVHPTLLGACRTWGIESEKAAERGQIVTISPAQSGTMVQECGEIWTAWTRLQPILPKSDRLLGQTIPIPVYGDSTS